MAWELHALYICVILFVLILAAVAVGDSYELGYRAGCRAGRRFRLRWNRHG